MNFLNWLGRLVIGCLGIAAAWGAWYVVYQQSLDSVEEAEKSKQKKPLAVEAMRARVDEIEERIVLVGTLNPQAQTEVRSKVSGYIDSIPFDVGDRVEKNQTLVQIDETDQKKAIEQARAALKVAEAQLRVRTEETRLAKSNMEREKELSEKNAGTRQQLETAIANHEIAVANEELDRKRVEEAQQNVLAIEIGLKDLVLKSPITGYVAERLADVGDLAKPDVALLRIVDLDTVETTVHVIEKDYRRIANGQSAIITVDAFPDRSFPGKVTRIAPILDPETRTAAVHIEVPNPNILLKPGMYGRVLLDSDEDRMGIVIPVASLVDVGDRPVIYVIDEKSNQVELRQVDLGISNGTTVEVREGVEPDELVVTLGNRLVQPNQEVDPTEMPWTQPVSVAGDVDQESDLEIPGG